MKKSIPMAILLLAVSGFTNVNAQAPQPQTGSYGVCDCEKKNASEELIKLKLNNDGTYMYVNNTNPSHKIENSGTWTASGKRIKLKEKESGTVKKWRIANNRKCVKSRKGLNFTRICLQTC